MSIYLLVKIHRDTGLRYLCQTKQNPLTYKGSGVDWRKHIKKFGNNVDTQIIRTCSDKKELKYWGRYYSKLWHVVTSMDDFGNKIWANDIPETGGGPGFTSVENSKYQIEIWSRPGHVEKMSAIQKNAWTQELREQQSTVSTISQNRPEVIEKHRENTRKMWEDPKFRSDRESELVNRWADPEFKKKMCDIQQIVQNKPEVQSKRAMNQRRFFGDDSPMKRPEVVKKVSETLTKKWEDPVFRTTMMTPDHPFVQPKNGKNNPRYDHTVYQFVHEDGTIILCTKSEASEKCGLSRYRINKMIKDQDMVADGWKTQPLDLK